MIKVQEYLFCNKYPQTNNLLTLQASSYLLGYKKIDNSFSYLKRRYVIMLRNIKYSVLILVMMMLIATSCNKSQVIKKNTDTVVPKVTEEVFPTRSIQLVIPYAPGGGTDNVARALALSANNYFSQPIIAVNKLGNSGARGLREGLFANNDGYTVTLVTTEINSLAAFDLIDFDLTDIEPLILLNNEPGVVVVSKNFPFDTIEELIDNIHLNEQIYTIGSAGKGSIWNLAAKGVEKEAGITFEHKYYDGTSLAVIDILGGKLDIVIAGISEVIEHIDNKQVKVLTVLSDEVLKEVPDVKTFKESGYDFSMYTWRGLAVPKNIDLATKKILLQGFTDAAKDKDFVELLAQINLHYDYRNQEEFTEFIYQNYELYKKLRLSVGGL